MGKYKWRTSNDLKSLLTELVGWKSITLSKGECEFPLKLQSKFLDLDYFRRNPKHLSLHDADLGRKFLTALYRHPKATETICLISHFDTVNTEEYGSLEPLATEPKELMEELFKQQKDLPSDVLNDLQSSEYLFGRGTMDMKMGLVLHMQLIEKASIEKWPINLLLLTVPDEEVNSSGMRCAVPVLVELQEKFNFHYKLFLNSEPVFTQEPMCHEHYIYSGTIGKILPAALFYGRETHVGEPLSGMTSPYMASFLTQEMEWNPVFREKVFDETTPLPVTLQQKDVLLAYSTQTPFRSTALYNILLMKQNAGEIFNKFESIAMNAAEKCNKHYHEICRMNYVDPIGKVKVIRYQKLLEYATRKFGVDLIEKIKTDTQLHDEWDEREKSLRIADKLMIQCQELAPAIIILFAPPYYPAVNSAGNALVEACIDFVVNMASNKFKLPVKRIHYFNGLCDLSYVNYNGTTEGWKIFVENTPVYPDSYTIPFEGMHKLNAPILNIGPFGKDAHKRTERLHIKNAFIEMPVILEGMIKMMMKN